MKTKETLSLGKKAPAAKCDIISKLGYLLLGLAAGAVIFFMATSGKYYFEQFASLVQKDAYLGKCVVLFIAGSQMVAHTLNWGSSGQLKAAPSKLPAYYITDQKTKYFSKDLIITFTMEGCVIANVIK